MVEFNNKVGARVSRIWVVGIVSNILKKMSKSGDVSVALVDDKEIKKLNKRYRKKNAVTDVLSFSNLDGGRLIMPESNNYLGEVIIGYNQMKRQAKEQGCLERRELLILLIHGVLHLLGYDHEQGRREARVMREKEGELLGMFR